MSFNYISSDHNQALASSILSGPLAQTRVFEGSSNNRQTRMNSMIAATVGATTVGASRRSSSSQGTPDELPTAGGEATGTSSSSSSRHHSPLRRGNSQRRFSSQDNKGGGVGGASALSSSAFPLLVPDMMSDYAGHYGEYEQARRTGPAPPQPQPSSRYASKDGAQSRWGVPASLPPPPPLPGRNKPPRRRHADRGGGRVGNIANSVDRAGNEGVHGDDQSPPQSGSRLTGGAQHAAGSPFSSLRPMFPRGSNSSGTGHTARSFEPIMPNLETSSTAGTVGTPEPMRYRRNDGGIIDEAVITPNMTSQSEGEGSSEVAGGVLASSVDAPVSDSRKILSSDSQQITALEDVTEKSRSTALEGISGGGRSKNVKKGTRSKRHLHKAKSWKPGLETIRSASKLFKGKSKTSHSSMMASGGHPPLETEPMSLPPRHRRPSLSLPFHFFPTRHSPLGEEQPEREFHPRRMSDPGGKSPPSVHSEASEDSELKVKIERRNSWSSSSSSPNRPMLSSYSLGSTNRSYSDASLPLAPVVSSLSLGTLYSDGEIDDATLPSMDIMDVMDIEEQPSEKHDVHTTGEIAVDEKDNDVGDEDNADSLLRLVREQTGASKTSPAAALKAVKTYNKARYIQSNITSSPEGNQSQDDKIKTLETTNKILKEHKQKLSSSKDDQLKAGRDDVSRVSRGSQQSEGQPSGEVDSPLQKQQAPITEVSPEVKGVEPDTPTAVKPSPTETKAKNKDLRTSPTGSGGGLKSPKIGVAPEHEKKRVSNGDDMDFAAFCAAAAVLSTSASKEGVMPRPPRPIARNRPTEKEDKRPAKVEPVSALKVTSTNFRQASLDRAGLMPTQIRVHRHNSLTSSSSSPVNLVSNGKDADTNNARHGRAGSGSCRTLGSMRTVSSLRTGSSRTLASMRSDSICSLASWDTNSIKSRVSWAGDVKEGKNEGSPKQKTPRKPKQEHFEDQYAARWIKHVGEKRSSDRDLKKSKNAEPQSTELVMSTLLDEVVENYTPRGPLATLVIRQGPIEEDAEDKDEFDEGVRHFKAEEYSHAKICFLASVSRRSSTLGIHHPDASLAQERLGDTLVQQGSIEEAYWRYQLSLRNYVKYGRGQNRNITRILLSLGDLYFISGNYSRALKFYEKSVSIRSECLVAGHDDILRSVRKAVRVHEALASKALEGRDGVMALNYLREMLWNLRLVPLDARKGQQAFSGGKRQRRGTMTSDISSLSTSNDDDSDSLSSSDGLPGDGENGKKTGSTDGNSKSFSYAMEAIKLLKLRGADGTNEEIASVLDSIAAIYRSKDQLEKARQCYREKLEFMRNYLGDEHRSISDTLFELGLVCCKLGEHQEAILHFARALQVQRKVYARYEDKVGHVLRSLAYCYLATGNLRVSLKFYSQYLDVTTSNDEMEILGIMGVLHSKLYQLPEALNCYVEALQIESRNLESDERDALVGIVDDLRAAPQRPSKAMSFHEIALDYRDTRDVLHNIGLAHLQRRFSVRAEGYLEDAFDRLHEGEGEGKGSSRSSVSSSRRTVDFARVLLGMGNILFRRNRYTESLKYYDQFLGGSLSGSRSADISDRRDAIDVFGNMGTAYLKTGSHQHALAHFSRGLEELEFAHLSAVGLEDDGVAGALSTDSNNSDTRALKSRIKALRSKHGNSEADEKSEDVLRIRHLAALVHCKEGRFDEALRILEDILRRKALSLGRNHPDVVDLYVDMSSLFILSGNTKKARETFYMARDRLHSGKKNHLFMAHFRRMHIHISNIEASS